MEIVLLGPEHDRAGFDCGKEPLNGYLQRQASEHARKEISKTWVAAKSDAPGTILGYITLAMGSVVLSDPELKLLGRLPRHPVPVLSIPCLATSREFQGRGVASELIGFAARKAIEAATWAGCFALELRPKDDEAHAFYVRRGFCELTANPHRMYMPVASLIHAFAA